MKYKAGDKVRVKSRDWYEANKDSDGDVNCGRWCFLSDMIEYCGQELTIISVGSTYYYLDEENCFIWTDEMLEDIVEESDILKAAEELVRAKKEFEKAKEKLKQLL